MALIQYHIRINAQVSLHKPQMRLKPVPLCVVHVSVFLSPALRPCEERDSSCFQDVPWTELLSISEVDFVLQKPGEPSEISALAGVRAELFHTGHFPLLCTRDISVPGSVGWGRTMLTIGECIFGGGGEGEKRSLASAFLTWVVVAAAAVVQTQVAAAGGQAVVQAPYRSLLIPCLLLLLGHGAVPPMARFGGGTSFHLPLPQIRSMGSGCACMPLTLGLHTAVPAIAGSWEERGILALPPR